jgi:Lecithin:cholesterol acyltransferase
MMMYHIQVFMISFLLKVFLTQQSPSNDTETSSQILLVPLLDETKDSFFDPLQPDPDSCSEIGIGDLNDRSCWQTPQSTVDQEETLSDNDKIDVNTESNKVEIGIRCSYGGDDPDARFHDAVVSPTSSECLSESVNTGGDKHWSSDPNILRMRNRLRSTGSGESIKRRILKKRKIDPATIQESDYQDNNTMNRRPPIFLMPGLASTRLVAWRSKSCKLSDIKLKDHVWLNLNLLMQMSTIDLECLSECLKLGWNQSDTDDVNVGCKLRPDDGLDAISSLSPGGLGSQLLGGTNTVYAWLIQWLAEHLGYDVTNIIGLPYDWRLSPDKMESRDGFLTLTRHRIEAAVQSNGGMPGILVAHSMGNLIFRYFLNWLRSKLREESFNRLWKQHKKRKAKNSARSSSSSAFVSLDMTGLDDEMTKSMKKAMPTETDEMETTKNELMELAIEEGDEAWYEWIEQHVWTYVGLAAPLLGAVNPVRSVISGESMGLPVSDEAARWIELTFGSTHTVNPVSTEEGFCDEWEIKDTWDEEPNKKRQQTHADSKLACMDDIVDQIDRKGEANHPPNDPWGNFPALDELLRNRADWDSDFPMIRVVSEVCGNKEKTPCSDLNVTADFGPLDVSTGEMFTRFSEIWKEKDDPLIIKRDQLRESFWDTNVPNILNETWSRPLIKHIVMAYGVDIPTEVGYEYRKHERMGKKDSADRTGKKRKEDLNEGIPTLTAIISELEGGQIFEERIENQPVLGDLIRIKKSKKKRLKAGRFRHSGDGSVPYLSLAWAHTWLLHSARALLYNRQENGDSGHYLDTQATNSTTNASSASWNPLDDITISHRPKGAMDWVDGLPQTITPLGDKKVESSSDTGTAYPHGTRYKPEMIQYHNRGTSRTTGINYTTTILEAIGVEHKETTRYDVTCIVVYK